VTWVMRPRLTLRRQTQKITKQNSQPSKYLGKIGKKNQSIKWYIKKTKQIAIKRIRTKSSIKIKRNKIMMNKIKKKNQENDKKKSQSKE
jgi:hypothetical protein